MKDSRQGKFKEIDDFFLSQRLAESRRVVKEAAEKSENPLVIQFSGGRDSTALVGLVQEVTDNFICSYMITGIEFKESIEFASLVARDLGVKMLYSDPSLYKDGFFERLERFQEWPTIHKLWCQRDLKVRAQKRLLDKVYGKRTFYKLVGVRRFESNRRRVIYPHNRFMRRDADVSQDYLVFPLLHWTDDDVENYLIEAQLPTSPLYRKYGVSGCYWCPFYQVEIYNKILALNNSIYDEFIEWEERLGAPSVIGQVYLKDLKREASYA